ncbi:MAG: hypothetical protein IPM52_10375 [Bacteroidetes bacterium]|nr:hypothetical protein [Bacteroidota bacterium]
MPLPWIMRGITLAANTASSGASEMPPGRKALIRISSFLKSVGFTTSLMLLFSTYSRTPWPLSSACGITARGSGLLLIRGASVNVSS